MVVTSGKEMNIIRLDNGYLIRNRITLNNADGVLQKLVAIFDPPILNIIRCRCALECSYTDLLRGLEVEYLSCARSRDRDRCRYYRTGCC